MCARVGAFNEGRVLGRYFPRLHRVEVDRSVKTTPHRADVGYFLCVLVLSSKRL